MITVICNVHINNDFKFYLLKETFPILYNITDNWLIYVRGKKARDVVNYIKTNFPDHNNRCIFFDNLYPNNWVKSTLEMLKKSKYDYIFLYWEDHFLMKGLDYFSDVIKDLSKNNIEQTHYSFYNMEMPTYSIEKLYPHEDKNIYFLDIGKNNIKQLLLEYDYYRPFSLASICKKDFFLKHLQSEDAKITFVIPRIIRLVINYILIGIENLIKSFKVDSFWRGLNNCFKKIGVRFVIFSKATPFNLEKTLSAFENYPLRIGILKEELFANRDDDDRKNTSLIKRGLYPKSFVYKKQFGDINFDKEFFCEVNLKRGQKKEGLYYSCIGRTPIPLKRIIIIEGVINIISLNGDKITMKKGDSVDIHPNIKHCFEALEDSIFKYSIINIDKKLFKI